ncbi:MULTISPECIES: VOC family protein [unclassified Crossiella]|uniref:VOC family protein n=1 Tax=unclassified Crossiella TaxID=2620835 RepID=UPI001FFF775C|nr:MULTISPECIES: VOC family protein [unclassified Crossiella]MCK2238756.1 VOC family protein [Crossiella sp. S99.2]MCK2251674.1 VOC family protein [Crossiella sp. S99.1]
MTDPNLPSIYPTLRYTDADAAVSYLTSVLGFGEKMVSRSPEGVISHAELSWGNGMIMIGQRSAEPSPFDTGRSVLYLAVADPDAHHRKAVAAGAQVSMPLTDQPYGSREYAVTDAEGNVWCFGTYQPAP